MIKASVLGTILGTAQQKGKFTTVHKIVRSYIVGIILACSLTTVK